MQAEYPALAPGGKREYLAHDCGERVLAIRCIPEEGSGLIIHGIFNFSDQPSSVNLPALGRSYDLDKQSFILTRESGEILFTGK
jgi:hypothetical protein